MISASISYRIPYADTDQMGVVYYANYLKFFEMARAELMRSIGFSYSEFERLGFALPVLEAHCFYHRPARFEDLITIRATMLELKGVRVKVGCEIHCNGTLLADGYTMHAFLNTAGRPVKPPQEFTDAVNHAEATSAES